MEISADPYEQKLFQMFQSCDKEQSGLLDEDALRELCGLLELRDKGAVLISDLAAAAAAGDDVITTTRCVSFERFKEALLQYLGNELDGCDNVTTTNTENAKTATTTFAENSNQITTTTADADAAERSLIICDETQSATELSDAENDASPDFCRKYERHCISLHSIQAQHNYSQAYEHSDDDDEDAEEQHNSAQQSEDDDDEQQLHAHRNCKALNCSSNKVVQRSSSQTDLPECRRRRPLLLQSAGSSGAGTKLKRCSSLPAQKMHRANYDAAASETASLTRLKRNTVSSEDAETHAAGILRAGLATQAAHHIIDIWKRAGIPNGKNILLALGFANEQIDLAQLGRALQEEVRTMEDDSQLLLLKALMSLQAAELTSLRTLCQDLSKENEKLCDEYKSANRRAEMFASEVDERHTVLEDTARKKMQKLEKRNTEKIQELRSRLASDREHWGNLNASLDERLRNFEKKEIKMNCELELLRKENVELDFGKQNLQKRLDDATDKLKHLTHELAEYEYNMGALLDHNNKDKMMHDVRSLMERIRQLEMENTSLRDREDEFKSEIENLSVELLRMKVRCKRAAELYDDDGEQSTSAAMKRRGDSPSKTQGGGANEESPRLGKLRKRGNDCSGSEQSDNSGEWNAAKTLNNELRSSQADDATKLNKTAKEYICEIKCLRAKLSDFEQLLAANSTDANPMSEKRCRELELSLEQMQRAYEDCEDYWQAKLNEERQLFEKERQIYEEEQQENDKKFTDLMEKVREYEDQFRKDGRLSPIQEASNLEQQYNDLEDEFMELQSNARLYADEKCKEIETLKHEVQDLRQRLGESVEILTGAAELSQEAAEIGAAHLNANAQLAAASSPISYLWQQSTIQAPATELEAPQIHLPAHSPLMERTCAEAIINNSSVNTSPTVSPIQKPDKQRKAQSTERDAAADCDTRSTTSGRSFENQSFASGVDAVVGQEAAAQNQLQKSARSSSADTNTNTSQTTNNSNRCTSSSEVKEELKRLKFFEVSLREQVNDLSLRRDGLVMELQQLKEARPVLERAYARTAHPTLMQRVNQLELRNRHLQNVVKQQEKYTERIIQQSMRQHQMDLAELHNRLESQGIMLSEQQQRLQSADVLVKDLYVENSNLSATVQQLEQQRLRASLMNHHQQQQQHHMQQQQQTFWQTPPAHMQQLPTAKQQQQQQAALHYQQQAALPQHAQQQAQQLLHAPRQS